MLGVVLRSDSPLEQNVLKQVLQHAKQHTSSGPVSVTLSPVASEPLYSVMRMPAGIFMLEASARDCTFSAAAAAVPARVSYAARLAAFQAHGQLPACRRPAPARLPEAGVHRIHPAPHSRRTVPRLKMPSDSVMVQPPWGLLPLALNPQCW